MEKQVQKSILVPTDFTEVSQHAIEFAATFAKQNGMEVVLINITKTLDAVPEATKRVVAEANAATQAYGVKVSGLARKGTIFDTISEVAVELDVNFMVMGTHGIKGMQKLTGSWAVKVMASLEVPTIVVMDSLKKTSIDSIVFPVDYRRETREKISWAYYVAKVFGSRIHILREKPASDNKIEQSIRNNLFFTEKFLRAKNIPYDVVVASGDTSFTKETLQFAMEHDADLMVVALTRDMGMFDYAFGTATDSFITNAQKIPVMCINPKKVKIGGFSATGA